MQAGRPAERTAGVGAQAGRAELQTILRIPGEVARESAMMSPTIPI
jgi:hypothetical protein